MKHKHKIKNIFYYSGIYQTVLTVGILADLNNDRFRLYSVCKHMVLALFIVII